mmetsp:Transcript_31685/g.64487  ORF Transcript_31685/g.64487 Transcript_31685/m.64487 type:complete len:351 (-) Transcript_31685:162-1214(-)
MTILRKYNTLLLTPSTEVPFPIQSNPTQPNPIHFIFMLTGKRMQSLLVFLNIIPVLRIGLPPSRLGAGSGGGIFPLLSSGRLLIRNTEQGLQMRPDLLHEDLPPLLVEEGEVVLHVARGRLGKLRRVAIPLLEQVRSGRLELVKRERHGRLVLLPVEEVAVVAVLALQALDELGIVAVVLGKDVGHLVKLVRIVLLVEGDDALLGGRTNAETMADASHDVILLNDGAELVTYVKHGGQDRGGGKEEQKDEGESFDPLLLLHRLHGVSLLLLLLGGGTLLLLLLFTSRRRRGSCLGGCIVSCLLLTGGHGHCRIVVSRRILLDWGVKLIEIALGLRRLGPLLGPCRFASLL